MPTHRQLVVRITLGLLLIVAAAACSRIGPQLGIGVDNTGGPKTVTVTVESSSLGRSGGEDTVIAYGTGAGWSVPLGSTWEIKVDGRHVIGSDDPTDFARSPGFAWQDLVIRMQIARDGTVKLLDAP